MVTRGHKSHLILLSSHQLLRVRAHPPISCGSMFLSNKWNRQMNKDYQRRRLLGAFWRRMLLRPEFTMKRKYAIVTYRWFDQLSNRYSSFYGWNSCSFLEFMQTLTEVSGSLCSTGTLWSQGPFISFLSFIPREPKVSLFSRNSICTCHSSIALLTLVSFIPGHTWWPMLSFVTCQTWVTLGSINTRGTPWPFQLADVLHLEERKNERFQFIQTSLS